jgi:hypothetical protein
MDDRKLYIEPTDDERERLRQMLDGYTLSGKAQYQLVRRGLADWGEPDAITGIRPAFVTDLGRRVALSDDRRVLTSGP